MERAYFCYFILLFYDYFCPVYDDVTNELKLKLEISLNACLRLIYGLPKFEHTSQYWIRSWLFSVAAKWQFFGKLVVIFHVWSETDGLSGSFHDINGIKTKIPELYDLVVLFRSFVVPKGIYSRDACFHC